ncbi:hypothetical protein [Azomonas macrocytogenes]|uniref:Uncharacterized protein n=1 Tax=Azomonas macrocytogenes TaxID=69962 RepID=A0A839T7U9_AZOMA|nr:hypothetical protein [Azomonas macrocytogenes]MBB3103743.1 hypothetical protein [Azomonas macrocytogenes]
MLIYRGVSKDLDSQSCGKIIPKGDENTSEIYAGSKHHFAGDTFLTIYASGVNARYDHNYCSDTYKTSYVSFSSSEEIAKKFATGNWLFDGIVYVVDTKILCDLHITIHTDAEGKVNNQESEVLIDLKGFDFLPMEAIVNKYDVLI